MGNLPRGAFVGTGVAVLTIAFGLDFERMRTHANVIDALYLVAALLFFVALLDWLISFWRKPETNKPRIALTTQIGRTFALVHLGGDAAQHIQVAPIQSALGKPLWIRFSGVDFLDVKRPEAYLYFRLDRDGNLTAERDMEKVRYVFFRRDTEGRETVDYPVTIVFQWKGRSIRERQTLTWHSASMALTTSGVSK